MRVSKTHKTQIIERLEDLAPGLDQLEADSFVEFIEQVIGGARKGRSRVEVLGQHDGQGESRSAQPSAESDWLTQFRSAISAVHQRQISTDAEVRDFRWKVLRGEYFESLFDLYQWVSGRLPGVEPTKSNALGVKFFPSLTVVAVSSQSQSEPVSYDFKLPDDAPAEIVWLTQIAKHLGDTYGALEGALVSTALVRPDKFDPTWPVAKVSIHEVNHPTKMRVRLDVHPSVPPNEVAALYEKGQRKLIGKVRRFRERQLALAIFTNMYPFGYLDQVQQWHYWNRVVAARGQEDWVYGPVTKPEEPPSHGFDTFRRDLSRIRRKLLDPRWKPKSQRTKTND